MKIRLRHIILGLVLPIFLSGCAASSDTPTEKILRVYTTRPSTADSVINSTFTSKTGIKVELVEVKDTDLINRLSQENDKTKADIILFNGAEKISELKNKKLLQPHQIEKNIGESVNMNFYGSDWVALTKRPRAFVVLKENTEQIESYRDIASDKYQKRVYMQATKSAANIGLFSGLYEKDMSEAEGFIAGIEKNVSFKSEESDIDQIETLVKNNDAKGVAVVDVASLEVMKQSKSDIEKAAYEKIKVVYPKEVFTNISVMSISQYSKQKDIAGQYMQYLLTREVQTEYMLTLGEYPVRNDVQLLESLAIFPVLTSMPTQYEKLGDQSEKITELLNKYNWE